MLKQTVVVGAAALVLSLGAAHAQQAKRAQPRIPVPGAALLKPQPEPACEYKVAAQPGATAGNPAAEAELRTKLDYERQCYRHAEQIARRRLDELQASVRATIRAVGQPKAAKARQVGGSRADMGPDRDALGGEGARRSAREAGSPRTLQP